MSFEDWQPIATAPKDGSSVLAFDPMTNEHNVNTGRTPRVLVMRWDTSFGGQGRWRADIHSFVPFDPTHWMPLPPNPNHPVTP